MHSMDGEFLPFRLIVMCEFVWGRGEQKIFKPKQLYGSNFTLENTTHSAPQIMGQTGAGVHLHTKYPLD